MPKRSKSSRSPSLGPVTLVEIPTLEQVSRASTATPEDIRSFIENAEFPPNETWNKKISAWEGDMTTLKIDAIVNAANSSLLGGGGIDGAIHKAAGPGLLKECRTLRGCETGDAKITGGYNLPAKHVIHTVGPQDQNPGALKRCYKRTLDIVKENKLKSVAFCCISTGIYGYDNEKAAKVALKTVREWLDSNEDFGKRMDRIIFCLFLQKDIDIYLKLLPIYFPPMRDEETEEFAEKAEGVTPQDVLSDELGETLLDSTRSVEENAIEKTADAPKETQAKDTDAWPSEETREAPLGDAPIPVAAVEDSPAEDKEPKEKENAAKGKKAEEKEHSTNNTRPLPK
ncbi:hypothetical protein MVEG_12175 [Podila verticillata NRRL 6337]|uniref:Macro domain-containing protein n=1 Tax=Podila verticillata NRRL 6337 TaxID=1069443 RepID=A0A086TJ94_9FUNG|nr:hypothetical protein MVEG_12175 [Podila verticillata NRRL 6337]